MQNSQANTKKNIHKMLGSDSGRTDFSRIFIFGPPDFFADFVAGFFLIFVGKKCPEKSSRKIPGKMLQNLYNKNPRHISAEGPGQKMFLSGKARGPGSWGGPGSWYSHGQTAHSSREPRAGTPSRAGTPCPLPFPKRCRRGEGSRPEGGVPARRGVGVPARGILRPIRCPSGEKAKVKNVAVLIPFNRKSALTLGASPCDEANCGLVTWFSLLCRHLGCSGLLEPKFAIPCQPNIGVPQSTWVKPGRFGSFFVLCFLALGGRCLQMLCLPGFGTHANTQNLPYFRACPASIQEQCPPKCLFFIANAKLPNRPGFALLQCRKWGFTL